MSCYPGRLLLLSLLLLIGCSSESRTAFRLAVRFDAALSLDQLRVEAAPQGAPGGAAPQLTPDPPAPLHPGLSLVLLVPDAWAGTTVDITVVGLSAGQETARGQVAGVVKLGEVVELEVSLGAPCQSACTPGETRCEKGQIRFCQSDAQGCARFSAPEPCPSDKPLCSGDACAAKCGDQCTSGARRCRDAGYQVCGKSDAGCLDWGPVLGCGAGETCRVSDGQCVLECSGQPCTCKPGETQTCADVGECKKGMRKCTSGEFGACEWQVGPAAETCDGKDNDCSSTPDDNLVAPACDKQQGVCQGAVKKCGGTSGWLSCTDSDYSAWAQSKSLVYEAAEMTCDGQDNDCNGKTDEPSGCCQPSCGTRKCGPDPVCGQSCGTCTAPATCDGSGQCATQPLGWSKHFGGAEEDLGLSVAVEGSANLYLAGSFRGIANFGNGPLQSAGSEDVFLASFASSGSPRWSHRFGGTGADGALGVAVDGAGYVYVVGSFSTSVDFGSGAVQSAGLTDIFMTSFTSGGTLRWAKRFGGTGADEAMGVAADGTGNVYVAGSFSSSLDFGSGAVQSAGGTDIFMASFTSAGALRWAKRFGSTGADRGARVATDGSDNGYLTGYYELAVDFGNGLLQSAGDADAFVLSFLTSNGAPRWSKRFGGAGYDVGNGLAVEASGNIYVSGQSGPSFFPTDMFLVSLGADGVTRWSRNFAGSTQVLPFGLAVDSGGNVYATGGFGGLVDFGKGPLQSAGGWDVFVTSFTESGAIRWSRGFGGSGDDEGTGLAIDAAGSAYVSGDFEGSVDFGYGSLPSAGGRDIFLLQLPP
jgi:hypothetical protein